MRAVPLTAATFLFSHLAWTFATIPAYAQPVRSPIHHEVCPDCVGTSTPFDYCSIGDPRDAELSPAECDVEGWQSRCWWNYSVADSFSGHLYQLKPFGLNVDLDIGVSAGDYPPLSRDVGASTSPLVSAGVTHYGAFGAYPERPVTAGAVDLITGVPLLRGVDFEIPFGSATFRHVRSYSEVPGLGMAETNGAAYVAGQRYWWDWHGQGWMIGEAPLFLIDAGYWGFAGSDVTHRRCYFMPDAHHAIPFIFSEEDGTYVAPPRFDAVLSHNGTWDEGEWEDCPTEFYVWLHGQSVKYTIEAVYEDMGYLAGNYHETDPNYTDPRSVPRHRSPNSVGPTGIGPPVSSPNAWDPRPGYGTPYLGLVTQIEDRHGNIIRIHYCGHRRADCDDLATTGCTECCQNCHEKGQISYVELLRTDAGEAEPEVEWTLVYIYREFKRNTYAEGDLVDQGHASHTAVATILAYDQQISGIEEHACFTIPFEEYDTILSDTGVSTLARIKAIEAFDERGYLENETIIDLPETWRIQARYLYLDAWVAAMSQGPDDGTHQLFMGANDLGSTLSIGSPELAMVSVTTRDSGSLVGMTQTTALRSTNGGTRQRQSVTWEYPRYLQAVWHPDTTEALREPIRTDVPSPSSGSISTTEWEDAWPVNMLFCVDSAEIEIESLATGPGQGEWTHFLRTADLFLSAWGEDTDLSTRDMSSSWLSGWDQANLAKPAGDAWSPSGSSPPSSNAEFVGSDFFIEMVEDYVDLESGSGLEPVVLDDGISLVVDGSAGAAERVQRVYRFYVPPNDAVRTHSPSIPHLHSHVDLFQPLRPIHHEPYVYLSDDGAMGYSFSGTITPDLANPSWVTVIDEYESLEDAAWVTSGPSNMSTGGGWCYTLEELATESVPAGTTDWHATRMPLSRRVVQINAAGYVLSDWRWDFRSGEVGREGLRQSFVYESVNPSVIDPPLGDNERPAYRLLEHRTYSFGAALIGEDEEDEGLCIVYAYDDDNLRNTSQPGAVGVRRGLNSDIVWTEQWVRDARRSDLVQFHLVFNEPVTTLPAFEPESGLNTRPTAYPNLSLLPDGTAVTMHQMSFDQDPDFVLGSNDPQSARLQGFDDRLFQEVIVGPPALIGPGTTEHYTVNKTIHLYPDAQGSSVDHMEVWQGLGSSATSNGEISVDGRFFPGFRRMDEAGRTVFAVEDYGGSFTLPTYLTTSTPWETQMPAEPLGFERVGPSGVAALNHWTRTWHTDMGPEQIDSVTGRRQYIVRASIEIEDIPAMETRTFNDVTVASNGDHDAVLGPGSITQAARYRLSVGMRVNWDVGSPPSLSSSTPYEEITRIAPSYDDSGNMTGISVEDPEDSETKTEASIAYDRYGELTRENHPDGTIVRNLSDPLGRLERVFRGSQDQHVFWGTLPPGLTSYPDDDMVLIEKRYYGDGGVEATSPTAHDYNNARRLTGVRRYRHRDANPYPMFDEYGELVSGPEEDSTGSLEELGYDWRGRHVATIRYEEGADPLNPPASPLVHTFTFYDNQDRVRFVATYGASVPTGGTPPLDPRDLLADCGLPTAAEILDGSVAPIRLSETRYNLRGQVEEVREYDVSDDTATSYLATFTYYDHAGRPIYVASPGGQVQTTAYDAKGRVARSCTGVESSSGFLELTRTETTYDVFGNAIAVVTFERLHDASTSTLGLSTSNGIASYTFNWYDASGKLTTVAEVGTGHASAYANASTAPTRPSTAPYWTEPSGLTGAATLTNPSLSGAKITQYAYDDAGRQNLVITPDGRGTKYDYDALGNRVLVSENIWDPVSDRRQTAYRYEGSRLVAVAALVAPSSYVDDYEEEGFTWPTLEHTFQTTVFAYGADVVAQPETGLPDPGSPVSVNPGLISAIHFPSGENGVQGPPSIEFTYYPDGLLATRTDARGVVQRHRYDELGNRTSTEVNTWDAGDLPFGFEEIGASGGGDIPKDIAGLLTYTYEPATSELLTALAQTWDTVEEEFVDVAVNTFGYNDRGDLTSESQQHGQYSTNNPAGVTAYAWDYQSAASAGSNWNRLDEMSYPFRRNVNGSASSTRRELTFGYGATDSPSDRMSRIASIDDSILNITVAEFDYAGLMRRVARRSGESLSTGWAIEQNFDTSTSTAGYEGLDQFGRIASLQFRHGSTLRHSYGYRYDMMDNPTSRLVTQATYASQSHDNQRSWSWGYDGLNRLMAAEMGELNPSTFVIGNSTVEPTMREESWDFDMVGNHDEHVVAPIPGAASGTLTVAHDTDFANEITASTVTPSGGSTVNHDFVYDAAGNLVLDDSYFYQYDGFGRLVKVSHRGTLELLGTGGYDDGEPGDWILHHTYDALGRLIRAQRPIPGGTSIYTEHYYYDGVRRIQEVHNNPVFPANDQEGSMDEETAPSTINATWVDREYIHTPGYVDEFVCETDRNDVPLYHMQDANFNVVGLVNAAGGMLRQYTLDPYGRVIRTEQFLDHVPSRLGHQGLFFDRLDAGITTSGLLPEHLGVTDGTGTNTDTPWLGAYQNRNRTYLPQHRRFGQGDPNGTGAEPFESMTAYSQVAMPNVGPAVPASVFADGPNRHIAYGNSPINHVDPEGLEFLVGLLGRMRSGGQMFMNYMGPFSAKVAVGNATKGAISNGVFGGASGGFNAAMNGQNVAVGILVGALQGAFTGAAIGATGGFAHAGGLHFAFAGGAAGGVAGVVGGAATGSRGWELVTDGVWGAAGGAISGGLAGVDSDWYDVFFGAGWAYGDAWKNVGRNNGWWP